VAAGHEVAVAVAPQFAPEVARTGLRPIPAGLDWLATAPEQQFPDVIRARAEGRGLAFSIEVFTRRTPLAMAQDLLRLFQTWRPDIVVHECTEYGGPLAAARAGLPSVMLGNCYDTWDRYLAQSARSMAPLRMACGLSPVEGDDWLFGSGYLESSPPEYRSLPLPPRSALIRPEMWEDGGSTEEPGRLWRGRHGPFVYVTVGTVFNSVPGLLERLVGALRDEPLELLVTVGPSRQPDELGRQPANVHIERYVPHKTILSECDAVVCHAGWGTVMGALSLGLPLVCIPLGADQHFNASRCAAMGVGVIVDGADTAAVRNAVRQVLQEPSFRAASQRVRSGIDAMPSPASVVGWLEASTTAWLGTSAGASVGPGPEAARVHHDDGAASGRDPPAVAQRPQRSADGFPR
jgi:UDP:flavonoid glycosyltransferase YjiC (YdhE family)